LVLSKIIPLMLFILLSNWLPEPEEIKRHGMF
jgi:hypothetical protein